MEEIVNAPATVPAVIEQPAKAPLTVGGRPRPIVPTDVDQVWRIASMVTKAGFAPRDMQSPEKVCIAIMHGSELGLPPMTSLQRIAVINGRPAVWGDAVPGIALATGLVEDWSEFISGEGDHMVATCRVKRKGIKTAAERTFSVADAKRANLWDTRPKVRRRRKDGSEYEAFNDSPWYKYPKRMLQMRARVAFRDLFADALGGLYIAEELDAEPEPMKDITPAATAKAALPQARSAPTAQETDYQKVDEEVVVEEETTATAAVETETQPQTTAAKKPLPPLAKKAAPAADAGDIPLALRRAAPPADEPEAYREWLVIRLGETKTDEDLQLLWDSHVEPNVAADQILPADLTDLKGLWAKRKKELAKGG